MSLWRQTLPGNDAQDCLTAPRHLGPLTPSFGSILLSTVYSRVPHTPACPATTRDRLIVKTVVEVAQGPMAGSSCLRKFEVAVRYSDGRPSYFRVRATIGRNRLAPTLFLSRHSRHGSQFPRRRTQILSRPARCVIASLTGSLLADVTASAARLVCTRDPACSL